MTECSRESCHGRKETTLFCISTSYTRRNWRWHPYCLIRCLKKFEHVFFSVVIEIHNLWYNQVCDNWFVNFKDVFISRVTLFFACSRDFCAILEDQLTDITLNLFRFQPYLFCISRGGRCNFPRSQSGFSSERCHATQTPVCTDLKWDMMFKHNFQFYNWWLYQQLRNTVLATH